MVLPLQGGECSERNATYMAATAAASTECIADERFVPTVLAFYEQTGTVDDLGASTFVDWGWEHRGGNGYHPRTFTDAKSAVPVMLDSYEGYVLCVIKVFRPGIVVHL